jgi:hypothetical protein
VGGRHDSDDVQHPASVARSGSDFTIETPSRLKRCAAIAVAALQMRTPDQRPVSKEFRVQLAPWHGKGTEKARETGRGGLANIHARMPSKPRLQWIMASEV